MPIKDRKSDRIRVLVADDNKEIRDKVVQLLRPEFDVVGTADDGDSACEAIILLKPEIMVLDISMPTMSGIEVAKEIKLKGYKTRTVFLTVHEDPDFIKAAIKVGASGYVIKSQMARDLISAMQATTEGKLFISPSCALS